MPSSARACMCLGMATQTTPWHPASDSRRCAGCDLQRLQQRGRPGPIRRGEPDRFRAEAVRDRRSEDDAAAGLGRRGGLSAGARAEWSSHWFSAIIPDGRAFLNARRRPRAGRSLLARYLNRNFTEIRQHGREIPMGEGLTSTMPRRQSRSYKRTSAAVLRMARAAGAEWGPDGD